MNAEVTEFSDQNKNIERLFVGRGGEGAGRRRDCDRPTATRPAALTVAS